MFILCRYNGWLQTIDLDDSIVGKRKSLVYPVNEKLIIPICPLTKGTEVIRIHLNGGAEVEAVKVMMRNMAEDLSGWPCLISESDPKVRRGIENWFKGNDEKALG